ncbi:hypothetical protein Tco_0113688, partial [Tanacetum coccineum]
MSSNHDDHNGDSTQSERRPLVSVDKDINILELRNSFNSLMDKDKVLDVADSQSSQTNKDLLNDDDEEVEDFYVEPDPRILKQQVHSKIGASTPTDEFLSNGSGLLMVCRVRKVPGSFLGGILILSKLWPWCILGDFNVSLHVNDKST